jgi:CRISPR-associated endonuclease/helicase Cas3
MHGRSDLAAYLAAAHHGKVRLSIRSMPNETRPPELSRRFARGIYDGELIQEADLGGTVILPATAIDLSYMELGGSPVRGPSWLARMLDLRDRADLTSRLP